MSSISQNHHYTAIISVSWPKRLGKLGIVVNKNSLVGIHFLDTQVADKPPVSSISQQIVSQIEQFFLNPIHPFSFYIKAEGSHFQKIVWRQLRKLAPGHVCRYGDLAKKCQTSARAIGNACRANPIPIVVPCHRVVAATGLGGYSGKVIGREIAIKKWLLNNESKYC